jgi:hypothetical protein
VFADLSWEFTLSGDVDVSTESLGLPVIPADLALQLSWIGDVAVTLQGVHTYGVTFTYAVNVTATLDFASAGIEARGLLRAVTRSKLYLLLLLCARVCALTLKVCLAPISVQVLVLNDPPARCTSWAGAPSRRRASTGSP